MIRQGHEVRLVDEQAPKGALELPATILGEDDIAWADLVIPSPGVPRFHPLLLKAKKVLSEIEVAMSLMNGKLIAITGSNGKTTTTTLIHKILVAAGLDAGVGGNISPPLITLAEKNPAYVVAEISSFQLEWIDRFRPFIGICLNITPDHLDRYPTMEEYTYFKKIMFKNMTAEDFALVSDDDPLLEEIPGSARRVGFSFGKPTSKDGAYIENNRVYFQGSIEGEGPKLPEGSHMSQGLKEDMMASALTARLLGVDSKVAEEVFAGFKVIHHRFEFVDVKGGVTFIDDSKATNVGAVDTALAGMKGPVILILGGKDKGGDFSWIVSRHKEKIRICYVIGEATGRIMSEVKNIVEAREAADMQEAVAKAYEGASSGDTVLLSPGCASFDQFRSYAHRGEVFQECVRAIK
jgi:UDP-N-acetylmuramoylalanine--D-glutamate ligase